MAKSARYKSLKKRTVIFGILSFGMLFVSLLVCLIAGAIDINTVRDGFQIFTD